RDTTSVTLTNELTSSRQITDTKAQASRKEWENKASGTEIPTMEQMLAQAS
ncbi:hypothetical protein CBL_05083, partial [Carabus blaptoides fortunei]